MVLVSELSSVKEESWTCISVFLFNGSMTEVKTSQIRLKWKPRPFVCWRRGLWSSSHRKPLFCLSVCNVRVVILQSQYVGPVTSVSTAVHSVGLLGVLRYYSVVLRSVFGFSSSTFTHVACWCFCQYSAWSPGDGTVCMWEACRWSVCLQPWSGVASCLYETVSMLTNRKTSVMIATTWFPLKTIGNRLCAALWEPLW